MGYNGLHRDYLGDILGLYGDDGKENGNYYNDIGVILGQPCFAPVV